MNKIILFLLPFLIITSAHSVHIINQTNVTLLLTNFVRTNGVVITGKKDLEPKKSFKIKDISSFTIKAPSLTDYYSVNVSEDNTHIVISEIEGTLKTESSKLHTAKFINQTHDSASISNITPRGNSMAPDTFEAKPRELLTLENIKSFTLKVGNATKDINLEQDVYVSITEESSKISIKCVPTDFSI